MDKVIILGARAGQALPYMTEAIGLQYASGERVILLVPEQYTLQAERELIQALQMRGMLDLDVLSPTKLRRLIHEKGGKDPRTPLDGRGRSMAIAQALITCREQLIYYQRVAASVNLPDEIAAVLSDFEDAGLNPDTLEAGISQLPSAASRAKMADICLIWRSYLALIEGKFADDTMQQEDCIRRLAQSGVVTGAQLWVYGFDLLQLPMCRLLAEAASLAAQTHVLMTMDAASAADGRLFAPQRRCIAQLIDELRLRNIPCRLEYLKGTARRDAALAHMEANLFTRADAPFTGDASSIQIHACPTPFVEAGYAAQTLRRWHDAGIPWQRMAVALSGEPSSALAMTLAAAGIPCYMARKDTVLRHGLCRMLVATLNAVTGGYNSADVLEAARSGFTLLSEHDVYLLENYAHENGIDRRKWLNPFTRGDNAAAMEALRSALIGPMQELHRQLRESTTATQALTAVYHLLENTKAYERLLAREEELLSRGMAQEATQNRQIWQVVIDLLEQLHALMGEKRAAMRDIARFVAAGLAGAAVSSLPPAPDAVLVGQAGHLMTGTLDALLVMGLQDGAMSAATAGLISECERAALSEAAQTHVGLSPTEQGALRSADFYRTFALPLKHLTLTFAEGAQDGTSLRPASLIADVKRLFPTVRITGGVTAASADDPLAPLPAIEALALRLREMADGEADSLPPAWQRAMRWLWHSKQYGRLMQQVVHGLDTRITPEHLAKDRAAALFGQENVSISRLEAFAACPYKHFVDYGLKPVQRRDFTFAPDEKGVFFHAALQGYATLASQNAQWPNIPDEQIDEMMDQVLEPLTQGWENGPLRENALARNLASSYTRIVRRAARMFTNHARNSKFSPMASEVAFGMGTDGLPPVVLTLEGGRRIALRGVIDRIDRYEGDSGLYLRIIDYKSSMHTLDPVRMWYGLQLQLMLYLHAATQHIPGAMPAGAFYFTVRDPIVDQADDLRAAAEQAIAKALQLKGVVLADAEVVAAMDTDIPGYSIGKVFNQDGSIAARAQAVDLNGMQELISHAQVTAAHLADEIRKGDISVSPASIGQWNECAWCEYAAVCKRDARLPGSEFRELVMPENASTATNPEKRM